MAYHPRENWSPQLRKRVYTRRDFLQRAVILGVALPALPSLLAACQREGGDAADLVVGTPANPVQQPLFDDNPAIESGLEPEDGPLLLYNWEDYMNPETIPLAAEALGVEIQQTTFVNEEEALARLSSGEVQYDVWFPTSQRVPVAVAASFIQPLNHDYLPNLEPNVWPQLVDPYYDQGSRYTVPYVTYTTGIGWRIDLADSADIEGQANPWDVFWNEKYSGVIGMLDSSGRVDRSGRHPISDRRQLCGPSGRPICHPPGMVGRPGQLAVLLARWGRRRDNTLSVARQE
jgi:spermidine/putrescine transport system substrate-binding protein